MNESPSMHPRLYEAAKSGDFQSLITTLENGEDLFHQTTPKRNNILHVAAQYEQVNFIQNLLQRPWGPSLLQQGNSKGDTPLHIAATVGSCRSARVFINLAKLHWPDGNGQVDAWKEVLRKPNLKEDTALHYAIRGGHESVVKLLIEEDPQLCDVTNAADESPLYLAADRGHLVIMELILSASSLPSSHKGPKGLTALHGAIGGPLAGCQIIIENRRGLIRERDEIGWTPLHYAASLGNVEVVQQLLQHDAYVAYDLDKEGQSALHIAAFLGHRRVIAEIVRLFPDAWDMINIKGQTALHVAARGGQVYVVMYILRMPGLNYLINEQDIDGNTALHLAVLHKNYSIIYILARDRRVDHLVTNNSHMTALDIFSTHEEVGYRAAKVQYLLGRSNGFPFYQNTIIEYEKKLNKQVVEGRSAITKMSTKDVIQLQLLVAVLIATGTFTAAFTMPGGYNNDGPNQGLAILAGKATFQAFVISNSTAFGFSILALVLQCLTWFRFDNHQARYTPVAGCCLGIAIIGMVLAFGCGTYAVLTKTIRLGIFPYVLSGCLSIMYIIGCLLDPHTAGMNQLSWTTRVRNFLFDRGMF